MKKGYKITDEKSKGPYFVLDPLLKYFIFIHDPAFYIHGTTPLPTPGVNIIIDEGIFFTQIFFTLTKHIKMNKKTKPCNEEHAYDFHDCVKKSFTKTVGCHLPWELRPPIGFPVCSRMDEIRHFEMMIFNLSYYSDLKKIIRATGCISPCVYNEYKLSSELKKISKNFFNANWVQLEFASDVRIEKEM